METGLKTALKTDWSSKCKCEDKNKTDFKVIPFEWIY
jgi:hypothetical protein